MVTKHCQHRVSKQQFMGIMPATQLKRCAHGKFMCTQDRLFVFGFFVTWHSKTAVTAPSQRSRRKTKETNHNGMLALRRRGLLGSLEPISIRGGAKISSPLFMITCMFLSNFEPPATNSKQFRVINQGLGWCKGMSHIAGV